ncbi:UNVERIFIED_CONTAM: hypothetical protein K2H54_001535 [Gekko kuhli]
MRGLLVYHDDSLDNLDDPDILLKSQQLLTYRETIKSMIDQLDEEIVLQAARNDGAIFKEHWYPLPSHHQLMVFAKVN